MAGPVRIAILADGSSARREFQATSDGASRMGKAFRTVGRGAAVGFVGLTAGAVAVAKASVASASAAQQSLGATETVFKRYADNVVARSAKADKALGLSANEYRELSNVLGASLAGAGVPLKETDRLTAQLNRRAADMAATFGGTTREAIESVGSALRGETDPIERYGVSLKASDVSARLAATGQDKLTGAAKKQAEMQARLDLLFQKTKTSQGAFSRESNTLAGQQQRLAASTENLKDKIGQALLPVLTKGARVLNREVVPALSDAADKYLPRFAEQISSLLDGDSAGGFDKVGASLDGIDWPKAIDGAKAIGDAVVTISKAVGKVGLDVFADGLSVTGEVLSFVADNSDTLAAALPFLAAGFVAIKAAQAAANIAMAAAVPLRLAELAASRQQTVAIRAMTAAVAQLTAAQAASNGAAAGMIRTQQGTYSAVRQTTAQTNAATRSITKMGGAARGAAGLAGIAALTASTQQADKSTGILLGTIGGAATGFSVGGPWGALIGGAAGAALGIFSGKADDAAGSASAAAPPVRNFADSLDQVSGAATQATRELVFLNLQQNDAFTAGRQLGLSANDLVSSLLGNKDAAARVSAALVEMRENTVSVIDPQTGMATQLRISGEEAAKHNDAVRALSGLLGANEIVLKRNTAEIRTRSRATQDLTKLTKTIPKSVVTDISVAGGIQPTVRGIAKIANQYNLTPKQVRTVIAVVNDQVSLKQVKRVQESLKDVDKQKVELTGFRQSFTRHIGDFREQGAKGGRDIGKKLEEGPKRAKFDASTFLTGETRAIGQGKVAASTGGAGIGSNLKSGFTSGFAGADGLWSASVRSAVAAAIRAGRAEAAIKSPSRKTRYMGEMMGQGLVDGVDSYRRKSQDSGRDMVRRLLKGMTSGSEGVANVIEKITALVEKQVKAKDAKVEAAREKIVLKGLRDEFAQLQTNGKQQDRNTQALSKARDGYKRLVEEAKSYAAAIKDAVVANASIVGLGVNAETQEVTSGSILGDLANKLTDTIRFQQAIAALRGRLNATSLQQIIDAGVQGGLATAEALAAATADELANVNNLTGTIGRIGGELGSQMTEQFKRAGISAAQAVVTGLEREQKRLDAVGDRLARRLVTTALAALGDKPRGGAREATQTRTATLTLADTRGTARRATAGPYAATTTDAADARADTATLIRLTQENNRLMQQLIKVEKDAPRAFGQQIGGAVSDGVKGRVPR